MHKLSPYSIRLFFSAFSITAILMFTALGFVLVSSSFSAYGMDSRLCSISTAETSVTLSALGREVVFPRLSPKPLVDFALDHEYFIIPRTLRLGTELILLFSLL